jgi:signal transduction histidine kinase/CheY-like chemotaxis protein
MATLAAAGMSGKAQCSEAIAVAARPSTSEPRGTGLPGQELSEHDLPRYTGWLRPAVGAVARIKSSVHKKLLSGFLVGALLLVGMAALSLLIIGRMNDRVVDLDRLDAKSTRAHEMLYDITLQSHYRAMALLTRDDKYNASVLETKASFKALLDASEQADPAGRKFYEGVRAVNDGYAESGRKVEALYEAGDIAGATTIHLNEEHPASHILEASMKDLIATSDGEKAQARAAFRSDRRLFTTMVVIFSATAVIVAMLLGFLLSWAFLLPVRKMGRALSRIAGGSVKQRVEVDNRDEFGTLAHDLNDTSDRLATLFDEQQDLTMRLSETNASLAHASEAKSRFLTSVSHELRTPMNAILGFTDAILAGVDGPLNDEQRASLEWVQRGGRDLLELINEILDLSKIESGKLTIEAESFDPRELVDAVVAQHRSLATQKGLAVDWVDNGTLTEVRLDRGRTRQIIVNLLGNACKFTQAGTVTVETSGAGEGRLDVFVRDTGPGIPASEADAIFEEFHQVEGAAPGTGLGLAISRRLARAMGGDVTVESELGVGTTFHLRLPKDCLAVPDSAPPAAMLTGEEQAVLLSVDDDPSVAPLLHKMLSGHGYRVVASSSPHTAVTDARRLQPAAILLDILMPGRDGEDVLRELKSDPETSGIPVIVISVKDTMEVPSIADAHLTKPVRQEPLLQLLEQQLASPPVRQ